MNDITDFLQNGVQQSMSDVQDALIACAEEDALEKHAILDMQEHIEAINQRLEIERQARLDSEKKAMEAAHRQKHIDRVRFWATFLVAIFGTLAAIGSLIATIVLN